MAESVCVCVCVCVGTVGFFVRKGKIEERQNDYLCAYSVQPRNYVSLNRIVFQFKVSCFPVCLCVWACIRVCVFVCVCARVCVCVQKRVCMLLHMNRYDQIHK